MRTPPERLETAEFVVRGWTEADGPALWDAIESSREHLRNMPWARLYQEPEQATAYVRRSRGEFLLQRDFDLAIFDRDESRVLGGTGFHLQGEAFDPGRQAEIGMWIRADRAGRGLGSRVLAELLRWGFDDWKFMRLVWRCNDENVASRRCAEKAGMLREGTMRGEYDDATGGRRNTACYGLCLIDFVARPRAAQSRMPQKPTSS